MRVGDSRADLMAPSGAGSRKAIANLQRVVSLCAFLVEIRCRSMSAMMLKFAMVSVAGL